MKGMESIHQSLGKCGFLIFLITVQVVISGLFYRRGTEVQSVIRDPYCQYPNPRLPFFRIVLHPVTLP